MCPFENVSPSLLFLNWHCINHYTHALLLLSLLAKKGPCFNLLLTLLGKSVQKISCLETHLTVLLVSKHCEDFVHVSIDAVLANMVVIEGGEGAKEEKRYKAQVKGLA